MHAIVVMLERNSITVRLTEDDVMKSGMWLQLSDVK